MDKLLEAIEGEKLVECLDMQDSEGNKISDPQIISLITSVYNQAVEKCKGTVKDYFNGKDE